MERPNHAGSETGAPIEPLPRGGRGLRRWRETITLRALKFSTAQCWLAALSVLAFAGCRESGGAKKGAYEPRAKGTVTFNKDIAPIVFNNCSGCHHPSGSAPFALLAYDDVKKRAKQVVDVTQRRLMPPWLPDPNVVHLVGERRLTTDQIGLIQQWASEGATEGATKDLPPVPQLKERWQLGEPDLVVKPTIAYSLPAEGRDIYRNLIIPIPVSARRYVRGLEFRPNSRAVHHAFFRTDKTGQSRTLDGKDGHPGFEGIHAPRTSESPITFASWQPGKTPRFYAEDLAWAVETNTDLILQMHLQPIGKEERIEPEVAFYFTDKPGTAIAFKLPLDSYEINIPAGATNYPVHDAFVLPVNVEVRGVLPHAHYLCKKMRGYADLPNGTRQWLMWIDDWDFNWQGDYQYLTPVALPAGTRLVMEYSYDNSTNNARNPSQPPRDVIYGSQSSDEMAELWLLTVMKTQEDFAALNRALQPRFLRDQLLANQALLRRNPNDARAHFEIGSTLVMSGKNAEALPHLRTAMQLDPNFDESHYFAGLALRGGGQLEAAQREFEAALRINPRHGRARGNLGLVFTQRGDYVAAIRQFEMALEINPNDQIARDMLNQVRREATKLPQ